MMRGITKIIRTLLGIALLLLTFEQAALAASGTIVGGAFFYNENGGYCPTSNACTGAHYVQAQFNTYLPISNAFVNVYDMNSNLLGQSVTDDAGQFTVPWTANPKPAKVIVKVFAWHKDSRFYFTDTNGAAYGGYTVVTLGTNATTLIFNQYWGTLLAPDWYFNSYWAAEIQWRGAMNYVGVLQTNFTNVEVRGFSDNQTAYLDCPTSCAQGSSKRVKLGSGAALNTQSTVMHELGHIADYVTKPWSVASDATWNGGAANQWSLQTGEYGHMAFNEAIATHYGTIAFWNDNSPTPTTCLTAATCYSSTGAALDGANVEKTSYPYAVNNCSTLAAAPEKRWPLSIMRYLWDVFDNHNDADGDSYGANAAGHFWRHLANTAYYPDGLGLNQINEPWSTDSAGTWQLTEKDGRGAVSWAANYASVYWTGSLMVDNCSPY